MPKTNRSSSRKGQLRVRTMKKERPEVQIVTKQRTGVVYWIGVSLYAAGVLLVIGGLVLAVVSLSQQKVPVAVPPKMTAQSTADSVTLRWTAPGDDAAAGQASLYDIRYSTAPLTEATFSAATPIANAPLPREAGQPESLTVTGLQAATTYYFGLKTADEVPNWSTLSNVATATTSSQEVACTPRWSCTNWSVCQERAQTRTCTDLNNCNTTLGQPIDRQNCTEPPPVDSCKEDWSCTEWSACQAGAKTRICTDTAKCGTTTNKPEETATCDSGGPPPGPDLDLLVSVPAGRVPANVRVFDRKLKRQISFYAFPKQQTRGASIAIADTDGDGKPEIIAGPGYGSAPELRFFTLKGKRVLSFHPFSKKERFGLRVATGDVDGDRVAEVFVTPAQKASSQILMYQYDSATRRYLRKTSFRVYPPSYRNGLALALADLNHDGRSELIAAPAGKSALSVRVYAYNLQQKRFSIDRSFTAFPGGAAGGLHLAAGDVDNDGDVEIVVSRGSGAAPVVRVFTAAGKQKYSFSAASSRFRGGVTVAALDTNQDGQDEIVTAVANQGPPGLFVFEFNHAVRRFIWRSSLTAYPSSVRFGLRLAATR